ncbi:MAG: LysM peptidoglycan-binding domain-containing protein [Deferrisomatales bacterium]
MGSRCTVPWVALLLLAGAAGAAEPDYRVGGGDTLWELSGRFRNDPSRWPELWSLNPHLRNPHRIIPGDPIFLKASGAEGRAVRLPLDRLDRAAAPAGTGTAARSAEVTDRGASVPAIHGLPATLDLSRRQVLDFVSDHRLSRLGVVDSRQQRKVAYGEGEDIELSLVGTAAPAPGTRLTLFDDSEAVVHPIGGAAQGYYVRVLGEVEVRVAGGGRAVGRILRSYDAIEDGHGVMALREVPLSVEVRQARTDVEGVILRGRSGQLLFATEDSLVLDRGRLHGLEPGVLLEIPASEGARSAQGVVDLARPLALLLVVDVQDKSASTVLVASRAALQAGDRFVASRRVSP